MIGKRLFLAVLLSTVLADVAGAETLRVGPKATYRTLTAAVEALPDDGGTIELAPGEYREKVTIAKPNVRLIGKGAKPQDVVIVWSDGARTAGGTFKSFTMNVSGDGFRAKNLTIQNDYHLKDPNPSQAVALAITADRAVLERVRLLGAQDTLYAASKKDKPSRQYFKDCYVEGHVDFIFGDAKAFFDRCHIHGIAHPTVMITAQSKVRPDQDSAYVFDRCLITADKDAKEIWFGRAWRPLATVVFMRSRIEAPLEKAGWREWTPGKTETLSTATFAEYASTGPGASPTTREPRSKQLTADQARAWDRKTFLAGPDGWVP
ncbi:pectinesterase family protein [Caulobacter sp. RL271]|jgi:pectinesterase|uniref:Pectinesterase family protein n=1 Tax=Caulobacter segnis TaxID=88688 RepID=A0ABY5A0P8_9CAUL|nr:pectinesterase family protein [Caulobacter segnis]USQ98335.1 pectinesterase family protein [Caulobacter segnis]